MPDSLKEACRAQNVTLQDYVEQMITEHPTIPFTFLQSKEDIIQRAFYSAIAASFKQPALISTEVFYKEVNQIFERYAAHKNFMSFMVASSQHCYTNLPYFYKADTAGRNGKGLSWFGNGETAQKLVDWAGRLPLMLGGNISTACFGSVENATAAKGTDYCDVKLAGRVFDPKGQVTLSRRRKV